MPFASDLYSGTLQLLANAACLYTNANLWRPLLVGILLN